MHNLDYGAIFIFLIFSTILSAVIVGASYLFSKKNPDPEKIGVYECGFSPYSDSRHLISKLRRIIPGSRCLIHPI